MFHIIIDFFITICELSFVSTFCPFVVETFACRIARRLCQTLLKCKCHGKQKTIKFGCQNDPSFLIFAIFFSNATTVLSQMRCHYCYRQCIAGYIFTLLYVRIIIVCKTFRPSLITIIKLLTTYLHLYWHQSNFWHQI